MLTPTGTREHNSLALDEENGAYLIRSLGRSKWGQQYYYLSVCGPQSSLAEINGMNSLHTWRFAAVDLSDAIEIGNRRLAKWLKTAA